MAASRDSSAYDPVRPLPVSGDSPENHEWPSKGGGSSIPRNAYLKLALYCLPFATTYFLYDAVAAVSVAVKSNMAVNNEELGMVFSSYSLCNTVVPLIVGVLASKPDLVWHMAVVLALGLVIGSLFTALAIGWNSFHILALGRLLTGLSSESFYVAGDALLASWFDDGKVGLAFGVVYAAGELGGSAPFFVGSFLQNHFGSSSARIMFNFCLGAAIVSFVAMLIIRWLDKARYDAYRKKAQRQVPASVRTLPQYFVWKLASVKRQSRAVWLIIAQCAVLYGGFYTVLSYAVDFLTNGCGKPYQTAAWIAGSLPLSAMVLSPLSGWLLKSPKRRYYAVSGMFFIGCICVLSMGVLVPTYIDPLFPLIGVSFGSAVIPSALWATLAEISREDEFPIVYGMVVCACNLTLTASQYLAGRLSTVHPSVQDSTAETATAYVRVWWFVGVLMATGGSLSLYQWSLEPTVTFVKKAKDSEEESEPFTNGGRST